MSVVLEVVLALGIDDERVWACIFNAQHGGLNRTRSAPFDMSPHPAIAVPCRMSQGQPVSILLVGKHRDEPTIYRRRRRVRGRGGLEEGVGRGRRV